MYYTDTHYKKNGNETVLAITFYLDRIKVFSYKYLDNISLRKIIKLVHKLVLGLGHKQWADPHI